MADDSPKETNAPERFLRARHRRLMSDLAAAEAEYRKDARFNGRLGAALALKAVLEYVVAPDQESGPQQQMRAMELVSPLTALASALASLDHGRVEPMVEPAQFGNAPPLGFLNRLNRAQAAAAMHALMLAGDTREVAARYVARKIQGRPYALVTSGDLWRAVARWRDELRSPSADLEAIDVQKFRSFLPHAEDIKRDLPPRALRSYADRILDDQVFAGPPVPSKAGA